MEQIGHVEIELDEYSKPIKISKTLKWMKALFYIWHWNNWTYIKTEKLIKYKERPYIFW